MRQFLKRYLPASIIDRIACLRYSEKDSRYRGMQPREVFQNIYKEQHWGKEQTISGAGSTLEQTEKIISEISNFLQEYEIGTLLDLPCGDFNWMQKLDLRNTGYIGGDIVEELILENNRKYSTDTISFRHIDLLTDNLPASDLVLNRDCFVHFSYEHIFQAMENIRSSGARYFMSTSFPGLTVNHNIVTGDWRPVNLEIAPFNFPAPRMVIQEYWEPGFEKEYKGKMLGVWAIEDLKTSK